MQPARLILARIAVKSGSAVGTVGDYRHRAAVNLCGVNKQHELDGNGGGGYGDCSGICLLRPVKKAVLTEYLIEASDPADTGGKGCTLHHLRASQRGRGQRPLFDFLTCVTDGTKPVTHGILPSAPAAPSLGLRLTDNLPCTLGMASLPNH